MSNLSDNGDKKLYISTNWLHALSNEPWKLVNWLQSSLETKSQTEEAKTIWESFEGQTIEFLLNLDSNWRFHHLQIVILIVSLDPSKYIHWTFKLFDWNNKNHLSLLDKPTAKSGKRRAKIIELWSLQCKHGESFKILHSCCNRKVLDRIVQSLPFDSIETVDNVLETLYNLRSTKDHHRKSEVLHPETFIGLLRLFKCDEPYRQAIFNFYSRCLDSEDDEVQVFQSFYVKLALSLKPTIDHLQYTLLLMLLNKHPAVHMKFFQSQQLNGLFFEPKLTLEFFNTMSFMQELMAELRLQDVNLQTACSVLFPDVLNKCLQKAFICESTLVQFSSLRVLLVILSRIKERNTSLKKLKAHAFRLLPELSVIIGRSRRPNLPDMLKTLYLLCIANYVDLFNFDVQLKEEEASYAQLFSCLNVENDQPGLHMKKIAATKILTILENSNHVLFSPSGAIEDTSFLAQILRTYLTTRDPLINERLLAFFEKVLSKRNAVLPGLEIKFTEILKEACYFTNNLEGFISYFLKCLRFLSTHKYKTFDAISKLNANYQTQESSFKRYPIFYELLQQSIYTEDSTLKEAIWIGILNITNYVIVTSSNILETCSEVLTVLKDIITNFEKGDLEILLRLQQDLNQRYRSLSSRDETRSMGRANKNTYSESSVSMYDPIEFADTARTDEKVLSSFKKREFACFCYFKISIFNLIQLQSDAFEYLDFSVRLSSFKRILEFIESLVPQISKFRFVAFTWDTMNFDLILSHSNPSDHVSLLKSIYIEKLYDILKLADCPIEEPSRHPHISDEVLNLLFRLQGPAFKILHQYLASTQKVKLDSIYSTGHQKLETLNTQDNSQVILLCNFISQNKDNHESLNLVIAQLFKYLSNCKMISFFFASETLYFLKSLSQDSIQITNETLENCKALLLKKNKTFKDIQKVGLASIAQFLINEDLRLYTAFLCDDSGLEPIQTFLKLVQIFHEKHVSFVIDSSSKTIDDTGTSENEDILALLYSNLMGDVHNKNQFASSGQDAVSEMGINLQLAETMDLLSTFKNKTLYLKMLTTLFPRLTLLISKSRYDQGTIEFFQKINDCRLVERIPIENLSLNINSFIEAIFTTRPSEPSIMEFTESLTKVIASYVDDALLKKLMSLAADHYKSTKEHQKVQDIETNDDFDDNNNNLFNLLSPILGSRNLEVSQELLESLVSVWDMADNSKDQVIQAMLKQLEACNEIYGLNVWTRKVPTLNVDYLKTTVRLLLSGQALTKEACYDPDALQKSFAVYMSQCLEHSNEPKLMDENILCELVCIFMLQGAKGHKLLWALCNCYNNIKVKYKDQLFYAIASYLLFVQSSPITLRSITIFYVRLIQSFRDPSSPLYVVLHNMLLHEIDFNKIPIFERLSTHSEKSRYTLNFLVEYLCDSITDYENTVGKEDHESFEKLHILEFLMTIYDMPSSDETIQLKILHFFDKVFNSHDRMERAIQRCGIHVWLDVHLKQLEHTSQVAFTIKEKLLDMKTKMMADVALYEKYTVV